MLSNNSAKTVTATFNTTSTTPVTYALTVTQPQNGTVTSTPAGINCGTDCIKSYNLGTEVTLTARPNEDFKFDNWGGDCSGQTCTLTMDGVKNVSATFGAVATTPTTYALEVTNYEKNGGTISSDPLGISCGEVCSKPFDSGTKVVLTAKPKEGWLFSGWDEACAGNNTTCTVTMDARKEVGAFFRQDAIAPKILSFTPSSSPVTAGSEVTLQWTLSGDAPDVAIILNNVDEQTLTVTGKSEVKVNLQVTTKYTLSVSNNGGDDDEDTTVEVQ